VKNVSRENDGLERMRIEVVKEEKEWLERSLARVHNTITVFMIIILR